MSGGMGRHTWTIIGHVARTRVKQRATEVINTSGSDTHTQLELGEQVEDSLGTLDVHPHYHLCGLLFHHALLLAGETTDHH